MPVTADRPAPYATAGAILDFIDRYRNRGVPSPIDGDVLARAGVAHTLIARTLQALHTLDLIDPKTGTPTQTLEALRLAPEDEFKNTLAEWLKSAYADIFAFVDPSKDGEARIRDAFRSYQPIGQQNRMVLLFQGLCAAAGLIAEKPAGAAAARTPARPRPAAQSARVSAPKHPQKPKRHGPEDSMHPALAGLLESLPDDGWTASERDKFLATFKAVLDFCIPIVSRKPDPVSEAAE